MTTDTLVLEVTAYDVKDRGGILEFGLQSRKGELRAGTPTPDGGLLYTCEARARAKPDGTLDCTGEFVHGPTGERFLYISFRHRDGGGDPWVRRTKVLLPKSIDAQARRLSARVADQGTSRVQFRDGWKAENGDGG
jgi:hypothetical protein